MFNLVECVQTFSTQPVGYFREMNYLPHCFFNNDLVEDLRGLNLGINIGESQIFALLYAADIGLIADFSEKLPKLVQHVKLWCNKWRFSINTEKTQIVHLRKTTTPKTDLIFIFVMSHYKSYK